MSSGLDPTTEADARCVCALTGYRGLARRASMPRHLAWTLMAALQMQFRFDCANKCSGCDVVAGMLSWRYLIQSRFSLRTMNLKYFRISFTCKHKANALRSTSKSHQIVCFGMCRRRSRVLIVSLLLFHTHNHRTCCCNAWKSSSGTHLPYREDIGACQMMHVGGGIRQVSKAPHPPPASFDNVVHMICKYVSHTRIANASLSVCK